METERTRRGSGKVLLAFVLAVLFAALSLSVPVAPSHAAGKTNDIKLMVMSDPHLLATSLIGDTADFRNVCSQNRKLFQENSAIIDTQLAQVRANKPDVLLISGDMTKDGELESHKAFEKKLERLKEEVPGLRIYVTNGNHDINNKSAKNYNTGGRAVDATRTSPGAFRSNYKVTWNDPSVIATYCPASGKAAGQLSYVARPKTGYTFIVIDSGRYSADNTRSGKNEHETSGQVPKDVENWALKQIEAAKKRGDTVIGMMHHNIVPHFSMEPLIRPEFVVNDYKRLSESLADAGMHFIFTGHMHSQDVAMRTTARGNRFYDFETGAGINYASPMRYVKFSRSKNADGSVRENVVGTTLEGLTFTYTEPTTGKRVKINNLKSYGDQKILNRNDCRYIARRTLNREMRDAGLTYSASTYDAPVNETMNALMDLKVSDDGHTLYDYGRYFYVHYLAGEDSDVKPGWFLEAEKRLKSGDLMMKCLSTMAGTFGKYPDTTVNNILKYLFFPQKYLKTRNANYLVGVNAVKNGISSGKIRLGSSDLKTLNQFYQDLVLSLSYDSNFANDKNFNITENEKNGQSI